MAAIPEGLVSIQYMGWSHLVDERDRGRETAAGCAAKVYKMPSIHPQLEPLLPLLIIMIIIISVDETLASHRIELAKTATKRLSQLLLLQRQSRKAR